MEGLIEKLTKADNLRRMTDIQRDEDQRKERVQYQKEIDEIRKQQQQQTFDKQIAELRASNEQAVKQSINQSHPVEKPQAAASDTLGVLAHFHLNGAALVTKWVGGRDCREWLKLL